MIRINKPAAAPPRLSLGIPLTTDYRNAFDNNPLFFIEGFEAFEFEKSIYGHKSVKSQLKAAQHGKCCFCESKFDSTSPGDVEHFRPKKTVYQDEGHPPEHPGYYWLAYTWSNLYYSCENCNRSNKRSFFPLSDPSKRARMHTDSLAAEQPLLLDPAGPEDPRDHICFHLDVPRGKTAKGRQTIKAIGLDRLVMNEARMREIRVLRIMRDTIKALEANPSPQNAAVLAEARAYLEDAVKPHSKFSAMAQDFLR